MVNVAGFYKKNSYKPTVK